ncbi:hypothetical protein FKP32DRAFT_662770 [Trametes sanguinea]|nr:hypothetical protein FKP32DRAFT_662770 [Trametes sanguinea]
MVTTCGRPWRMGINDSASVGITLGSESETRNNGAHQCGRVRGRALLTRGNCCKDARSTNLVAASRTSSGTQPRAVSGWAHRLPLLRPPKPIGTPWGQLNEENAACLRAQASRPTSRPDGARPLLAACPRAFAHGVPGARRNTDRERTLASRPRSCGLAADSSADI